MYTRGDGYGEQSRKATARSKNTLVVSFVDALGVVVSSRSCCCCNLMSCHSDAYMNVMKNK